MRLDSSMSILFPSTTKGKFSGSCGDACPRRSAFDALHMMTAPCGRRSIVDIDVCSSAERGSLALRTHPSIRPKPRTISSCLRHTPAHNSRLLGRRRHREIGIALDRLYPTARDRSDGPEGKVERLKRRMRMDEEPVHRSAIMIERGRSVSVSRFFMSNMLRTHLHCHYPIIHHEFPSQEVGSCDASQHRFLCGSL